MLVPIFLILVCLQAWHWSWTAYPFLVCLVITGVMVTDNLLHTLLFWLGVTWAGCLIPISHCQKGQVKDSCYAEGHDFSSHNGATGQPAPKKMTPYRVLLWQLTADVLLLILLLLMNTQPTLAPLDIHGSSNISDLASLGLRSMIFALGAAALLMQTLAWSHLPWDRFLTGFSKAGQIYIHLLWVSITLVAAYQAAHLGYVCLPLTQGSIGTVGIVLLFLLLASAVRWRFRLFPQEYTGWQPQRLLLYLGRTFLDGETKIGLEALDFAMSALGTVGVACIDFETRLLLLGQATMGVVLAAGAAPTRLYQLIMRKKD